MSGPRTALAVILLGSAVVFAQAPYQATTESLRTHKVPQWYEDAKFGVFLHWGPYAVPAYHEWYVEFISPKSNYGFMFGGPPFTATQGDLPPQLFLSKTRADAIEYHKRNWGADFPYDNFLPMFKAEKFDPDAWAKLFREAGAQYVVMTAKHGDEYAMWPSKFTHRNAKEVGPNRDLLGDLTKSVRAANMRMGFYHNTTYTFWDQRYPGRDWVDYMNNSIKELVDLYHPDILWGDVSDGPVKDVRGNSLPADYWGSKQLLSYFYNHSEKPTEVLANDRWGIDLDGKRLGDFATPERARLPRIRTDKWETCDSLDPFSWGYNRNLKPSETMTTNQLVDYLVDVVSKNGNLLINIGPKADGTIPDYAVKVLQGVGEWLKVNGEAIYGSHYWENFKDGDVRFTRKGNVLYAIALEWPEDEIRLTSLAGKKVNKVEMLGLSEAIQWKHDGAALVIQPPSKRPGKYAYTFRITTQGL